MSLLATAKKIAHAALDWRTARFAPGRFSALRNSLLVLSYHRVLPRDYRELGIVEPGMFVYDDTFRLHLDELGRYFEPVDLADWLQKRAAGEPVPDRAVAITFDDGWRDNYRYAFPLLREFKIPATVFVVSSLVDTEKSFWPERLARRLQAVAGDGEMGSDWLAALVNDAGIDLARLDSEAISRGIATAKRESDTEIHRHLDRLDDNHDPVVPASGRDLADWSELTDMVDSGLVAVGSHTRHHVRMREDLTEQQLHEELVLSQQDIKAHCGQQARLFCYPNGDTTSASADIVRQHYAGACTTQTGWNSLEADPYGIRRVPLHEDRSATREAFLARLVEAL